MLLDGTVIAAALKAAPLSIHNVVKPNRYRNAVYLNDEEIAVFL